MTDDKLIEAARLRHAHGNATELDEWRLRAAERREQRTMARETSSALDTGSAEAWNEWFVERFDEAVRSRGLLEDVGEVMGTTAAELREEYTERLHALELTVARLEGELKGLRANDTAGIAKLVGDALDQPLCNYIDERVKAMRDAKKGDVVDLPKMNWRRDSDAA
jgi:hypothetical protein